MAVTVRLACWGLLLVAASPAAKLPDWYVRTLDDAEFRARLVRDLTEIERVTGDRLESEVILVEFKVRLLYGSKIALRRTDFLLRARNTNDTSPAQGPDRIAGSGVLALGGKTVTSGGGIFADATNPGVWGGAPGTGTRPKRLPGPPSGIGGGTETSEQRTVDSRQESETPVLERLQAIELPLEADGGMASGYLYFEIPAKVKRKHLELSYDGGLGEFLIEFKKPE